METIDQGVAPNPSQWEPALPPREQVEGDMRVECVKLVLVSLSLSIHWPYCQEHALTLLMFEFV